MPNARQRKGKNLLHGRFVTTIADNISFAEGQGRGIAVVRARHTVPLRVAKMPRSVSQDNASMCLVDVGQFDLY